MLQIGMSREIVPDYETQYLFPPTLEQWVEPDDPARFIREFVHELDLRGLREEDDRAGSRDTTGRPHYGFELLLGVWLYGYVYGIRSARELERGCRQLLPLMWLAGTHQPDHNTLWRFWSRYRGVLRRVFEQSVKVAWKANLIGMVLHAADGTKIVSRTSRHGALHEDDLRRVMQRVEQRIERIESQIEQAGEGGEIDDRLPEELTKEQSLRETIRAALDQLESAGQKHLHPLDPDARMMKGSDGRVAFSYNAQAVADDQHGVVVAADVTNEANDGGQLAPMIDQVEHNLGENAETTVADRGYDTAEGLGHAEQKRVRVVVASKVRLQDVGPYHASRFTYEADSDQVQCPLGERLARRGTNKHKHKPYPLQTYHCAVTTCPVRRECSRDPRGRVIEIGPHHNAVVRNRQRSTEPSGREALRRRGATIERLFAEIKEVLRFRRWTVNGIDKVQSQWLMICTAMNLRRMIFA